MQNDLYCPRCGKQFSSETVYCRTCGLSLRGVSEIVSGEAESEPIVTRRPNFKLFRIGIVLFIVGLVIGLINGALRDFELFPQAYGKLVFMLFVAAGMLLLGSGFLFPTKKYTKRKTSRPADDAPNLDRSAAKANLGPATADDEIYIPPVDRELEKVAVESVTEHTTRNLDR